MDPSVSSVSYGRHNLHLEQQQHHHHHPFPEEEEHVHHHRKSKKKSNGSSSKRSSSSNNNNTPPSKGILKTSNPTTEDFLRKNEELLLKHKRQLLQSRSADNTLERRRSDEDIESSELLGENEPSHSPHRRRSRSSKETTLSSSTIYATDPGSRRHHRHHRSSGGGGEKKKKKSTSSKNGGELLDSQIIYDRPKVPALKISNKSSRKYSSPDEGLDEDHDQSNDIGFYENLKYPGVEDNPIVDHIYSNDNCLYDVPRPGNKRIMDDHLPSPPPHLSNEDVPESGEPEEAIYINSEYENNQDFYDVPKFRMEEPLTTIQEGEEVIPAPSTEQELYENYPPVTPSDDSCSNNNNINGNNSNQMNNSGTVRTRPIIMNRIENIYMNESYSDRGSSGYRSSPSIQSSEELYVNETAIPSEDDEDEQEDRSGHQIEPVLASVIPSSHSLSPDSRDIAIGTYTKDKKRASGKAPLNSEEQRLRELKREKERHKALLIEAEILKKREENNNNHNSNYRDFSSSLKKSVSPTKSPDTPETLAPPIPPPPPPLFIEQSDLDDNKDILVGEEEDKPVSVDFEEFDIENPTPSQRIYHVPEPKKFTPKVEKNRSIEVYNETVRQRAQRKKTELIVNNSSSEPEEDDDIEERGEEKKKDKGVEIKDVCTTNSIESKSSELRVEEEDKDMPSVQKLRSRFERSSKTGIKKMGSSQSYDLGGVRGGGGEEEGTSKPVNSAAKVFNVSAFQNNVKKKGGFRVMASLTRRSAVSISRALQDEEEEVEGRRGSSALSPPVPSRTTLKGRRKDDDMSQHQLEQQHVFSSTRESRRNSNRQVSLLSSSKMFTRPPVSNLWDPTSLISSIYDVNSSSSSFKGGEETNGRHNYFEGYMDRLPSGKRKATIWNSWKTQYFVLTRGSLTAYFDESKKEAQDIFELFSGKVERMDSNIIGVTDRRGHFILLRIISKSNNEDEDEELTNKWINLLDIHSKKDYSSTFITPGTYDISLLTKIIVVDFGGASVRAGIASRIPTLPKIFFPSVMAVARDNEREKYFGLDAFAPEVRARCDLFHPMSFDRRTIDLIAFQGMFEKIFKDLGIDDPAEYELQLSVPRSLDDKTKIAVSSVLFEEFGIRSLNMAHQAVFSMYAYQSKTGIVVDIGERMDIIPIVDGYKVGSGMSRSPVGGRELRNRTAQYLQVKNHNLSTSSPVDDYVLRAALEKSAYVARNFDRELEIYEDNYEDHSHAIPYGGGGKELVLSSERFEAIEGLFKPELWGLDQAGVHVLVHKAVRECPVDVRKEVTKSIYCSGGLSSVPGFAERLELEMERLTPNVKPKVHASIYSYHAAYLGAESHALSEGFDDMKMSREVWYSSEGNHTARMWTL